MTADCHQRELCFDAFHTGTAKALCGEEPEREANQTQMKVTLLVLLRVLE